MQSFRLKIQSESDYSRTVGESLVLLLDRHEDFTKSELLGRVFAHQLMGDLSQHEFRRIARAIDVCGLDELVKIKDRYSKIEEYSQNGQSATDDESPRRFTDYLPSSAAHQLFSAGLVDQDRWIEVTYTSNDIGRKLIGCLG